MSEMNCHKVMKTHVNLRAKPAGHIIYDVYGVSKGRGVRFTEKVVHIVVFCGYCIANKLKKKVYYI